MSTRPYSPDEIIQMCWDNVPEAQTLQDITNIRMAARLAWEQKEMGGLEHVQFAYRNGTPIVPVGHSCHPLELVKRGFVDGKGWSKNDEIVKVDGRISISRWPDGTHYYARIDGNDVVDKHGKEKWDTWQQAYEAALEKLKSLPGS